MQIVNIMIPLWIHPVSINDALYGLSSIFLFVQAISNPFASVPALNLQFVDPDISYKITQNIPSCNKTNINYTSRHISMPVLILNK